MQSLEVRELRSEMNNKERSVTLAKDKENEYIRSLDQLRSLNEQLQRRLETVEQGKAPRRTYRHRGLTSGRSPVVLAIQSRVIRVMHMFDISRYVTSFRASCVASSSPPELLELIVCYGV